MFLATIIGVPLAMYLHKEPTCFDGIVNQGETSPDHGGPCVLLDEWALTPHAVLWARAFRVREGIYDAVAYVENPNAFAGLARNTYRMKLYDSENVLVAERTGVTPIMPGGVTPVFEGGINSGNRIAVRAIFELEDMPVWQRMRSRAPAVTVSNRSLIDIDTSPRLTAQVQNTSVADLTDLLLVAVIFDPAGNAFASSQTAIARLSAGESRKITFTWPEPFLITVGRIDILPVVAPEEVRIIQVSQ